MINKEQEKPNILVPVERDDEHYIERHATFLKRIEEGPIDLLFIGDSITRRWVEFPDVWNYYFSKYNTANFGVGSDLIQNLKWRILNEELDGIKPKVIVLLIGTNNLPTYSGEEVLKGIKDIVEIIHDKQPDAKIILMGILPRNPDEVKNDYIKTILFINNELAKLEKYNYIYFLDIGDNFIGTDGKVINELMPDGLHLVDPGYKIWGDNLLPVIEKNMN